MPLPRISSVGNGEYCRTKKHSNGGLRLGIGVRAPWLPCVRLFPRVQGKCPQSGQKGPVSGRKAVERSETEGLSYISCSLGRREYPFAVPETALSRYRSCCLTAAQDIARNECVPKLLWRYPSKTGDARFPRLGYIIKGSLYPLPAALANATPVIFSSLI